MKKRRARLDDLTGGRKPPPTLAIVPAPTPERKFRPHSSIYLSKPVQRVLRRIAADIDRRPHDLLIEGVELVLQKYGQPTIAEIETS